ncbi:alpha/beta fold hydrolase [Nocardia lijiangensis]|uniref:alpha/beta fold hydrolase n=1 Tax=Nocardia lijiangensis TaxID=299618 RepID=UPI003D711570
MASPTTVARSVEFPDVSLYYEVRGDGPLIVLAGAPMSASDFAPLADLLATDHTVLTVDPRGHRGSVLADPNRDSTPALRGEDLARLIDHLGIGPAVVLGSSGGAVSALALLEAHPDLVTTVVAHEPPLVELLDDRAELRAGTQDMIAAFRAGDVLGAFRKFFAQANISLPEPVLEQMFGGDRDPAQLASEHYWFNHELLGTVGWLPDLDTLRATPARVVIGIGVDSAGQLCDRSSRTLAAALGLAPTMFPGDHIGFVGDPSAFAAYLRGVLRGD